MAGTISYTLAMRWQFHPLSMTMRLTSARLCSLIIAIVATGIVGEVFAGDTVCLADSSSGSKTDSRLAFNARGPCPYFDSRLLADQSAPGEFKDIQVQRKAAEEGDAHAQFDLGLRYESGRGVSKDVAEAIKWFRKAAEQGFDEAQYALGCCYNGDDGYPKDSVEAVKWWGKAGTQGYADAQYCLGLSYFAGEGVAKNPVEAAKWWKKAADQGQADAQYFLGLSYSLGLGVPKIREQAIYWLRKAAVNGNENAMAALIKLDKIATSP
jgi:hypothetical protein